MVFLFIINMINQLYLQYIPEEKKEECYNSMIRDVYYFYYGIYPSNDQIIICINNNKFDLDKNNLKLISII